MPPEPQRHVLTDFEKGEIIALSHHYNPTEIGQQLGIARETVKNFLKRFHERGSAENLPRPGRPRKTSSTSDRWLQRTALAESKLPLQELKSIYNIPISTRTIQRRLRTTGVRKWRAVKRALLTTDHTKEHLKWAKAHQGWTIEDWAKVIWSDESAIKKDSDTRTVWIWRHQNKREKYLPKNVRGKKRDGGISQMVWGCFSGKKLGPIVFVDTSINQDVYMGVLEQHLLEYIEALKSEDLSELVFQQDNASPHTAKRTQEWLQIAGQEHGFRIMRWPANSPDLNPIENLWAILKIELHRRYPDTKYLKGSINTIRTVLKERLQKVWWDINEEVLNQLLESMPHRVHEVIKAGGWYTSY
jgi:transposase